jgi:sterol desaturase/sphingolipid hydroxylase (fatty acid hydroxylase superfamily)
VSLIEGADLVNRSDLPVVKFLGYPLLVAWPLVVATWVLTKFPLPLDPLKSKAEEVALFLCIATPVVLILMYLERRIASQPEQRVSKQDTVTDLTHLALCWFAVIPIAQQLVGLFAYLIAGTAATRLGLGIWPTHWPLLAQLMVAVVVGEFGQYWVHRLAHTHEIAWRVHATHHGTPQVYWLNSTRFHAIELIVKNFFQVSPLILLGCSRECFLLYGIFTAIHGWVQHSNVGFRTGVLNYFMATPQNHRWHHSPVLSEGNTNFGVVTPIWDHIFRSFYAPWGRVFQGPVGIAEMPDFPKTYVGQLLSPFTWEQLPRVVAAPPPQQQDDTQAAA